MAIKVESVLESDASVIERLNRLAEAMCAPRRYHEEPCMVCRRPVGAICDLDRHAIEQRRARAVGH